MQHQKHRSSTTRLTKLLFSLISACFFTLLESIVTVSTTLLVSPCFNTHVLPNRVPADIVSMSNLHCNHTERKSWKPSTKPASQSSASLPRWTQLTQLIFYSRSYSSQLTHLSYYLKLTVGFECFFRKVILQTDFDFLHVHLICFVHF